MQISKIRINPWLDSYLVHIRTGLSLNAEFSYSIHEISVLILYYGKTRIEYRSDFKRGGHHKIWVVPYLK